MEGHVVSDLLLYRIGSTGDNDNYGKIISPIIIIIITRAEEPENRARYKKKSETCLVE